MRRYIEHLRHKPVHHQKRAAFLVSGLVTLLIFTVWSMVKFGGSPTVATDTTADNTPEMTVAPGTPTNEAAAVTPAQGFMDNLSSVWNSLKNGLGEAKQGLNSVDLQSDYTQMKNQALSNGQ